MQNNLDQFIESAVVDMSWHEYITMEGTWADHIIMQAIAEIINLRVYTVESNDNFAELTLFEPLNASENSSSIYIGHIGEMHYVSTEAMFSENSSPKMVKGNLFDDSPEFIVNNCKRECMSLQRARANYHQLLEFFAN